MALPLSDAWSAVALDSLEDPISVFTLDGVYLYINAAGETLLGKRAAELVGRTYLDAFPDLATHPYHEVFQRLAAAKTGIERLEFYYPPMDVWSSQRMQAISGFIIVQWRNITERKRAEQEQEKTKASLEEANRTKDEFLAMLGHELRNPLAPITTALQLMRLRGAGILERERGVIERQVNHLVLLVNDLLDIARITSGKVSLTRQRLELADVIAKALEMAGPLIDQRQHRVTTEVPRGLLIDGDAHRLGQVFANILTNAAKYTPPGGRIEVSGSREGRDTVVHVTDTGVGIPAQLLPRVFDLFVQGHQAIDRERGGLGLGLAIVRHLVAMHGGQVSVSSGGANQGTRFTVRLHAAGPDEAVDDAPLVNPTPRSAGRRVLVVDDNEDAADLLAYALQTLGYQTRKAYDAASALRIVDTFRPEVALLDIGLPVMNGYELAQQLRGRVELHPLRLVALTGYGQDRDRDRAKEAGFDAHVVKPVDLTQLAALLDE